MEVARAQRLSELAAAAIFTAQLRNQELEERRLLQVAERRDAVRDMYVPALVPTLPLAGCTSSGGCRCTYMAPVFDPRRRPPPVPAERLTNLTLPSSLRDAARFGSDPKGKCKGSALAEYLEEYPLLPHGTETPLHTGEVVYLARQVKHAWESSYAGAPRGIAVPFGRSWRHWTEWLERPEGLPAGVAPRLESSRLLLTNWRLLFVRADLVQSLLLADILRLEYFENGLGCSVAERTNRLMLFVDDPLQVGLYIARAVSDIASAERRSQAE